MSTPSSAETASAVSPRSPVRLTVALVVHEEPQLLPDTLDSVRGLADEILIVETGSPKQTWQFASRHGARVLTGAAPEDLAAARNLALGEARGQWLLWLEAGEVLTAESREAIAQYLAQSPPPTQARMMYLEAPSSAPGGRAEQQAQLRWMPRVEGLEFVGRVCETARPALIGAGVSVELAAWRVVRSRAWSDLERCRRRWQRELRLLNLEIEEHGPRAQLLLALGELETSLGEPTAAAGHFRRAISLAPRGSREMLEGFYGLLTTFDDTQPAGRQAQLAACLEALEVYPFDAQLLCAAGGYLEAMGQTELARRSLETAVRYGQVSPETWHLVEMGEFTASLLALHCQTHGDDAQSAAVLAEAVARLPGSHYLKNIYFELLVKLGRTADALALVEPPFVAPADRDGLRSAVRGACQAAKQNWIPALAYLETAYSSGCRHLVCLKWYTVALLSTGAVESARPVLAAWLEASPHDAEARRYQEALAAWQPAAASPETTSHAAVSPAAPLTAALGTGGDLRQLRIDAAREPGSLPLHLRLGEAYRAAGDREAALAVLRDFVERHPTRPEAVRPLCELLIEAGQVAEAVSRASDAVLAAGGPGFAAFLQAADHGEAQNWQRAADCFERAHKAGYHHPLLVPQWSICLVKLGRFEQAQHLLREISSVGPPHFALGPAASRPADARAAQGA